MIYASSSLVINTSATQLWQIIEQLLTERTQGNYISECTIQETYYDGFSRSIALSGESTIKERVFMLKDQNKVVTRLEDNPLLIGDTIYQIIASDNPELSERRVTLCVVIAWRMRPGIIEAPMLNKQALAEDLTSSIKAIAEQGFLI